MLILLAIVWNMLNENLEQHGESLKLNPRLCLDALFTERMLD